MPEGDTVWLTAKRLRAALAGSQLVTADLRVPALATADLTGATTLDVVPRGKHVLMRFDLGLTLHSHLRLDGTWRLARSGERTSGGTPHEIRVVLTTDAWRAVGYRIHDLALLPTSEEAHLVGHLGPALLGADWDPDEAVRRLRTQPDREIGDALLDQRNLAGIGNLYKAETLYLRGLSPWTRVADVPDLSAVVRLAHRLMSANRESGLQVTTGNTRRGERNYVFERSRRPCRRCGTPILVTKQGDPPYDRLTYWCPRCQPMWASEPPTRSPAARTWAAVSISSADPGAPM